MPEEARIPATREDVLGTIRDALVACKTIGDEKRDTVVEDAELLEDLGIDSMDEVELVTALEDEFKVSVDDDLLKTRRKSGALKTVGGVIDMVMDLDPTKLASPAAEAA